MTDDLTFPHSTTPRVVIILQTQGHKYNCAHILVVTNYHSKMFMKSYSSNFDGKVIPCTWSKHVYAEHAQPAESQVKLDKIRSQSVCNSYTVYKSYRCEVPVSEWSQFSTIHKQHKVWPSLTLIIFIASRTT